MEVEEEERLFLWTRPFGNEKDPLNMPEDELPTQNQLYNNSTAASSQSQNDTRILQQLIPDIKCEPTTDTQMLPQDITPLPNHSHIEQLLPVIKRESTTIAQEEHTLSRHGKKRKHSSVPDLDPVSYVIQNVLPKIKTEPIYMEQVPLERTTLSKANSSQVIQNLVQNIKSEHVTTKASLENDMAVPQVINKIVIQQLVPNIKSEIIQCRRTTEEANDSRGDEQQLSRLETTYSNDMSDETQQVVPSGLLENEKAGGKEVVYNVTPSIKCKPLEKLTRNITQLLDHNVEAVPQTTQPLLNVIDNLQKTRPVQNMIPDLQTTGPLQNIIPNLQTTGPLQNVIPNVQTTGTIQDVNNQQTTGLFQNLIPNLQTTGPLQNVIPINLQITGPLQNVIPNNLQTTGPLQNVITNNLQTTVPLQDVINLQTTGLFQNVIPNLQASMTLQNMIPNLQTSAPLFVIAPNLQTNIAQISGGSQALLQNVAFVPQHSNNSQNVEVVYSNNQSTSMQYVSNSCLQVPYLNDGIYQQPLDNRVLLRHLLQDSGLQCAFSSTNNNSLPIPDQNFDFVPQASQLLVNIAKQHKFQDSRHTEKSTYAEEFTILIEAKNQNRKRSVNTRLTPKSKEIVDLTQSTEAEDFKEQIKQRKQKKITDMYTSLTTRRSEEMVDLTQKTGRQKVMVQSKELQAQLPTLERKNPNFVPSDVVDLTEKTGRQKVMVQSKELQAQLPTLERKNPNFVPSDVVDLTEESPPPEISKNQNKPPVCSDFLERIIIQGLQNIEHVKTTNEPLSQHQTPSDNLPSRQSVIVRHDLNQESSDDLRHHISNRITSLLQSLSADETEVNKSLTSSDSPAQDNSDNSPQNVSKPKRPSRQCKTKAQKIVDDSSSLESSDDDLNDPTFVPESESTNHADSENLKLKYSRLNIGSSSVKKNNSRKEVSSKEKLQPAPVKQPSYLEPILSSAQQQTENTETRLFHSSVTELMQLNGVCNAANAILCQRTAKAPLQPLVTQSTVASNSLLHPSTSTKIFKTVQAVKTDETIIPDNFPKEDLNVFKTLNSSKPNRLSWQCTTEVSRVVDNTSGLESDPDDPAPQPSNSEVIESVDLVDSLTNDSTNSVEMVLKNGKEHKSSTRNGNGELSCPSPRRQNQNKQTRTSSTQTNIQRASKEVHRASVRRTMEPNNPQINNLNELHFGLPSSSYISLPGSIQLTKSVVNIQNKDHKCFMWSVLASLHANSSHNHCRVKQYYKYIGDLNMEGIESPVSLDKIDLFEKLNPNITVNIFGYDSRIYPIRVTKFKRQHHVNLLYLTCGPVKHYCWIKSLKRLLASYCIHHPSFYCNYCLRKFNHIEMLNKHVNVCYHFVVKTNFSLAK